MSASPAAVTPDTTAVTSDIIVDDAALRVADLTSRYGHLDGIALLRSLLTQ